MGAVALDEAQEAQTLSLTNLSQELQNLRLIDEQNEAHLRQNPVYHKTINQARLEFSQCQKFKVYARLFAEVVLQMATKESSTSAII